MNSLKERLEAIERQVNQVRDELHREAPVPDLLLCVHRTRATLAAIASELLAGSIEEHLNQIRSATDRAEARLHLEALLDAMTAAGEEL